MNTVTNGLAWARLGSGWRRLPIFPVILLAPMVIFGILGTHIAPYDPGATNPVNALKPPSWLIGEGFSHLFGTDYLGRDVFSRVIAGARASLTVSVVGVGIAGCVGICAGLVSGYFGGWAETILMRLVDIQMSMPPILLALLLSASLGTGLWMVIFVVAVVFWTNYARVLRGEVLSVRQRDYVVMARVLGCRSHTILRRHILPNVIDSALVVASLQLGAAVILEASLSFLGLGVQPPAIAWGKMIAEAKLYLATAWWLPFFPGLALVITVLGANMLGDWLRDRLDPKLRNS
ncbi:ABC-type transporter, integral membrane subunit [Rhizobium sp. CF080]|uniref:ABC transporter permease n=1 Tax=Rhizobium sp. (strain CF080) TaxID=1144310 RepID=UPI00027188B8|nr:ABC transporter permease [Rhizobium sp. CF080]EUB99296.1 ABC-type transporter, integral membrane subunit [Rhizobium sp. CF080]